MEGAVLTGDTIAAISTPLGEGGIGIVRMSGPDAAKIAGKIFRAGSRTDFLEERRKLVYGHIVDQKGKDLDEVLLCYMPGPNTYTREDVVEINCHGGIVPLRRVLEEVLARGARLARPGEFSKRAFLNGRLDLAQAESVIDIIRSKTNDSLNLAVSQLRGKLSWKVNGIQKKLLGLLAQVEANIDFPEEDLEEVTGKAIVQTGEEIVAEMGEMIRGAATGRIYREGISTIIIGRTNVGKSSLLNALLRENRAIVTDIPGTTRDLIEEVINIRGIPLKVIDTAGLRETDDLVEKIGVEKTRESVNRADLALVVLDAVRGLNREDRAILELIKDKKALILINKIDASPEKIKIRESDILELDKDRPVLFISATKGIGLEEMEDKIFEMVMEGRVTSSDTVLVANVRHKEVLERSLRHLSGAIMGIRQEVPVDIVAIDLRGAWETLGEITGSTATEDLLDRIFEDFCIGK
ncbi:MAG: tRNA modification GTPase MnmE [Firmicutes bacterium ADurb.Bin456]|nr:MAG: tRNA modification GTPase MnmE [Firmicutes bacterium ADurb.Bin456]